MICSFFKTLFREECSSQMKVHEDGKGGGPLPIMERKANHWAEIFINIFVFFLFFLSSSSILFWCCLILKCSCWDHQAVRRVPCASMKSDTSFVGVGFYSQRRSPWRREILWMMIWKKNGNGKRIMKTKSFLNKLILFMWVYLRYVCKFREPVCTSSNTHPSEIFDKTESILPTFYTNDLPTAHAAAAAQ